MSSIFSICVLENLFNLDCSDMVFLIAQLWPDQPLWATGSHVRVFTGTFSCAGSVMHVLIDVPVPSMREYFGKCEGEFSAHKLGPR